MIFFHPTCKALLIILLFLHLFTVKAQIDTTASDSALVKEKVEISDSLSFIARKRHRIVENKAFVENEFLHFTVSYGVITAGYATIEVDRLQKYNDRDCLVLRTTAKSRKAFNWIFKVNDWTESYLDKERFHSHRFEKHLREGSYHKDIVIEYDQEKNIAEYTGKRKGKPQKKKTIKTPDNVMDALSALFYVRTKDFGVGDEILIPASDNKKIYNIKVVIHKRETIEIEAGTFDCFVVEPIMADGGIFKKNGKVKVWLTADQYRMPVKMETKVYIGSIKAELGWYETGRE